MLTWMAYALFVSVLLVVAGHLLEDVASNRGLPRRGVWMMVLFLSAVVPLFTTPVAAPHPEAETTTTMVTDVAIQPPPVNGPTLNAVAAWGWLALSAAWLSVAGTVLVVIGVARRRWKKDRLFDRDVLVSEAFGPALVGIHKADIVIPSWVFGLSERDTQIVVTHEDEHRRSRDHLTLLAGGLAAGVLAWNPLVWWSLHQLRRTVELDCDQRVLGHGVPAARYGRVLLDISTGQSKSWGFVPGMVHPKSTLERRLRAMGKGKTENSTGWIWFSAIAGCALMFAACETPAPTGVRNAMDSAFEARLRAREAREQEQESLTVIQEAEARASEGSAETGRGKPIVYVDGIRVSDSNNTLELLDPHDIERIEVINGRAAEARVTEGSAETGRGKPIVFVDGIRVSDSNEALELLDPKDIERIEVIKGGAAEVIYGNAAQNGVIQIFLKKSGREGAVERELAGTLRRRELAILETQQQVQRQTNTLSQRLLEARGEIVVLQQSLAARLRERSLDNRERIIERLPTDDLSVEIRELEIREQAVSIRIEQVSDRARELARRSTADLEQALARVETELHEARTSMSEVERDRLRRSQTEIKAQIEAVRQRAARQIRR